jgi:Ligand-gated ion channel
MNIDRIYYVSSPIATDSYTTLTQCQRKSSSASRRVLPNTRFLTLRLLHFLWLFSTCRRTLTTNTTAIVGVNGQQAPFAFVPKFDRSVSHRTKVCDRQLDIFNGTYDLPNALQGLNLSVAIPNYIRGKEKFYFTLDAVTQQIDPANPGLFALILDELAARAGFQWRDTFVPFTPLDPTADGNRTWTDILTWSIETFDISMESWSVTVERLALPVSLPAEWYDNSIVLAEIMNPSSKKPKSFHVLSFLDPFHSLLWLTVICAIVITGFVYFMLEMMDGDSDERELQCKPIASIFYAAITFTGHYELRPQAHPARLVGFSFTFWALIVGSAYTANLASFLVVPSLVTFKYETVDKVLKDKAYVCVQEGAAISKLLSQLYPSLILIPKSPDEEIYAGLRLPRNEGGCDVAAHQFYTYEIYKNLRETNADCNLRSDERIVKVLPGTLATAVDTGSYYCTSLISHVLEYHLTAMTDDGFLERTWKSHLDRIATVSCGAADNDVHPLSNKVTSSLTVYDIGGIFIVHVTLSIIAIMIATIQFYRKHRRGEIRDNRSLGTAFGITQAKQAIEYRMSSRNLNQSNNPEQSTRSFTSSILNASILKQSIQDDSPINLNSKEDEPPPALSGDSLTPTLRNDLNLHVIDEEDIE